MPTDPNWFPLIGGGSDPLGSLASQRFNWTQYNSGIDIGNINRANEAQAVQNQWLKQLSDRRDAQQNTDIERQIAADTAARNSVAGARQDLESNRRFDIQNQQEKDRVAAENLRTKAQYEFPKQQEAKDNAMADNAAKFLQPQIASATKAKDKAQEEFLAAENAWQTRWTQVEKQGALPPNRMNKTTHEFDVHAEDSTQVQAAIMKANSLLSSTAARHTAATLAYQTAASTLAELHKRLIPGRQFPDSQGNLYDAVTGKTYKADGSTTTSTQGSSVPSVSAPPAYAGFGSRTATAAVPSGTPPMNRIVNPDGSVQFSGPGASYWQNIQAARQNPNAQMPPPQVDPQAPLPAPPVTGQQPPGMIGPPEMQGPPAPTPPGPMQGPVQPQSFNFQPESLQERLMRSRLARDVGNAAGNVAQRASDMTANAADVALFPGRVASAIAGRVIDPLRTIPGDVAQVAAKVGQLPGAFYSQYAKPWVTALGNYALPPTDPNRIRVRSPNGIIGTIRKTDLREAAQAGYTLVQE